MMLKEVFTAIGLILDIVGAKLIITLTKPERGIGVASWKLHLPIAKVINRTELGHLLFVFLVTIFVIIRGLAQRILSSCRL